MSPTGRGDPDSMNAARNSPSVLPPFTNIWIETEIDPALSPHLENVSRLRTKRRLHSHRNLRRIATK